MSYLANALKKYYSHQKSKILFCNKYSLGKISLLLWEYLGYRSIDPSVLSKVIHGKRLFTPQQLNAFCSCLNLQSSEREYLFFCLNKDYLEQRDVFYDTTFSSGTNFEEVFQKEYQLNYELFYSGDCNAILQNHEVLLRFINSLKFTNENKIKEHSLLFARLLFLHGWAIGCFTSGEQNLLRLRPILNELRRLFNLYKQSEIYSLFSYVYCLGMYALSEYSHNNVKKYREVIRYGENAIENIEDINKTMIAMRNIIVAASRTQDKRTIEQICLLLMRKLDQTSDMLNIAGLSLIKNSLTNSICSYKSPQIQDTIEILEKQIHCDFTGKHIYAISNSKDKLEFSITFQSTNAISQNDLLQTLILAKEEKFSRQQQKILKLLQKSSLVDDPLLKQFKVYLHE